MMVMMNPSGCRSKCVTRKSSIKKSHVPSTNHTSRHDCNRENAKTTQKSDNHEKANGEKSLDGENAKNSQKSGDQEKVNQEKPLEDEDVEVVVLP